VGDEVLRRHHYFSCVASTSGLRSLSLGATRHVMGPIDHKVTQA
jgi:hypothetical protein